MIRPWKELDFFSSHRSNICSTSISSTHQHSDSHLHSQSSCSIEKMKVFLNCPSIVFMKSMKNDNSSEIYEACKSEIEKRKISPPLFTGTASPSLLFSAPTASPTLMQLYQHTMVPPLFIVLFRNPVDWLVSMYNHGMVSF